MKALFKFGMFTGYYDMPTPMKYFRVPLPTPVNVVPEKYNAGEIDTPRELVFELKRVSKFEGEDIAVYERVVL